MPATTDQSSIPDGPPLKTGEHLDDFQLRPAVLTTPFKKIAMALSGGGYRAAAFSLGAMSYLHQLKPSEDGKTLLDNVVFVSSASGGTFAAILYSMHVRLNTPFETTYRQLLAFMNGEGLLDNVLERINEEDQWKGDKSRNFINAFAKIYHEKLFDQKTLGVYWLGAAETITRHIEVCFNATEFYRGISFRWHACTDSRTTGLVGNNYLHFNNFHNPESETTLKQVRLGDILAASSCFPAGFEPILFPKDFTYTDAKDGSLTEDRLRKAFVVTDYNNNPVTDLVEIGLMDGGVNDNQGVYSAILADKRRRLHDTSNGFDLIFVTDVASYFMDPYQPPPLSTAGPYRKETIDGVLNKEIKAFFPAKYRLLTRFQIYSVLLLLLSLAVIYWLPANPWPYIGVVLSTISVLVIAAVWLLKKYLLGRSIKTFLPAGIRVSDAGAVAQLKRSIPSLSNFSDDAIGKFLKYITTAPLGVIEQLLKARLNSTLSMVLDINLKTNRRMIFDTFFGSFYGEDTWENRRCFNVIYELSTLNIGNRKAVLTKKFAVKYGKAGDAWSANCLRVLLDGCEKLNEVAESARNMPTTLWFDKSQMDNHTSRDVVACGQFTTCAKMLEYVYTQERVIWLQQQDPNMRKQVDLDDVQTEVLRTIREKLEDDWSEFKTDPYALAKRY